MGNKLAREFQKLALEAADWERVRTEERPFFQDAHATGIGSRRLTLIHCPSFDRGYAWDIREIEDRFRLYRSRVCHGSTQLKGYDLLQFESKPLREYLRRLQAIKIALHPTGRAGLDGTSVHLGIFSGGVASIQLSWWGEPQNEWKEIGVITEEMRKQFSQAPLFETDSSVTKQTD
ncbi:MAG: hypothetical protein V4672_20050 [Verrucomicrobiota bacterium]